MSSPTHQCTLPATRGEHFGEYFSREALGGRFPHLRRMCPRKILCAKTIQYGFLCNISIYFPEISIFSPAHFSEDRTNGANISLASLQKRKTPCFLRSQKTIKFLGCLLLSLHREGSQALYFFPHSFKWNTYYFSAETFTLDNSCPPAVQPCLMMTKLPIFFWEGVCKNWTLFSARWQPS